MSGQELFLLYIIGGGLIYFVPTIAGWKTKYATGILLLNLFLGWTVLGWIGALIWAVSAPKEAKVIYSDRKNGKVQLWTSFLSGSIFSKRSVFDEEVDEVSLLRRNLEDGEAIIQNKLTENYEVVSAEKWERIINANRADDYLIVDEK